MEEPCQVPFLVSCGDNDGYPGGRHLRRPIPSRVGNSPEEHEPEKEEKDQKAQTCETHKSCRSIKSESPTAFILKERRGKGYSKKPVFFDGKDLRITPHPEETVS
jgi:hypothetical protein